MSDLGKLRVGFVGAGRMAEAMAKGLVGSGLLDANSVAGADPDPERRHAFTEFGATALDRGSELCEVSDIIVLAVKPQAMPVALAELAPAFSVERHLAVSIAAGVTLERLAGLLPAGARIIRSMPNTPLQVGKGATALARGASATDADMAVARAMFDASGETVVVEEARMDAVTALSGSGPAYVFFLAECMIEAGVAEGLDRAMATMLAAATIEGAGRLMLATGEPPAELRRRVTSPGGTTQAALEVIDDAGVRQVVVGAVRRAAERSGELSSSR